MGFDEHILACAAVALEIVEINSYLLVGERLNRINDVLKGKALRAPG